MPGKTEIAKSTKAEISHLCPIIYKSVSSCTPVNMEFVMESDPVISILFRGVKGSGKVLFEAFDLKLICEFSAILQKK